MRYIRKGDEPSSLSHWKKKNPKENYGDFCGAVKQELKEQLLKEQNYLCCYCESEIEKEKAHIEHVFSQCDNPKNVLDYQNLLISCDIKKHCGYFKSNKSLDISPLNENCSEHFTYSYSGEIKSKTPEGESTIKILGLNDRKLIEARKSLIYHFNTLCEEQDYIDDYLTEQNGKLKRFYSLIFSLYGVGASKR